MARSNKKIVRDLFAMLVKRYPKQPPFFPKERQLLDHLIYAVFLENSSFQVASESFLLMENTFVDWNEVRVTTARELADMFHKLYQPIRTGERLRRTLQWVFDTVYKFDLEDYRTKGANETAMFLNSNPFTTPFITTHTIAAVYKMQEVPLGEGAMQVFRLLDLVDINYENREVVNVLANALNQSEKIDFFRVIHQLGVEMLDDPKREACLDFLRKLDAMIDERTHIPLVESPALLDPAQIAREVSQAVRKAKPPLLVQLEELEMVEEPIEDIILTSELSVYIDEENGLTEQSYELDEELIIRSTSRGKTETDSEVISKKTVVDIVKVAEKTTKKKDSPATELFPLKEDVGSKATPTKATPTKAPAKKEPKPVQQVAKPKETPTVQAKVASKVAKPSVAPTAKANPPAAKKSVSTGSTEKSGAKKAVSKSVAGPVAKTASKAAPKVAPKKKTAVPVKSPAKSPVKSAPKSKESSVKSKTATKGMPKKKG